MGSRLFSSITLMVVSIFLIALGAILTLSVVFMFIGIPLLIFGLFVFIISLLSMVFGTVGDVFSLLMWPFRKKKKKVKVSYRVIK